jgi:hypothetical protein
MVGTMTNNDEINIQFQSDIYFNISFDIAGSQFQSLPRPQFFFFRPVR